MGHTGLSSNSHRLNASCQMTWTGDACVSSSLLLSPLVILSGGWYTGWYTRCFLPDGVLPLETLEEARYHLLHYHQARRLHRSGRGPPPLHPLPSHLQHYHHSAPLHPPHLNPLRRYPLSIMADSLEFLPTRLKLAESIMTKFSLNSR